MIVGIDLGTTHSLLGMMTDDGPRMIPNALGDRLTPSVVGVDEAGTILVGASARERLHTHPDLTTALFKRTMGTEREITLGHRRFRPEELSALVLRSLIHDAEVFTGQKVEEAVISVPAYFSDAQRKATRNAGQLAGIRVERLINEPTAAALAYGLEQRDLESRFVVLDLGGGTFDVSILELFEGVMEVHATAGDNFLGGEEFVDVLAGLALADLNIAAHHLSPSDNALLRGRMELLKKQLSRDASSQITLTIDGHTHDWHVQQDRFETACAPLLSRMRAPIERAMRDARLTTRDINEVVLVGGASRMPMVVRLASSLFGRLPLRHINPDEAIGQGATVMAGLKSRHASLNETVVTDVCPYTLGIEVADRDHRGQLVPGQFSPVIERNTIVPASREKRVTPIERGQPALSVRVFQGESPRVADNIFLGEIDISLPRYDQPSEMPVDIRFTYDVNGLLEVEATLAVTGERERLVIQQNPGLLSPAEIDQRLAGLSALKIHPREDQANQAVIARAERLYAEHQGDLRAAIAQNLLRFRGELETQDPAAIQNARSQFTDWLNSLDRDVFA